MTTDTMQSEAQKRLNAKWKKENVKRVTIRLYKNTDKDLIEYIESLENVQGTLKQIIRHHIKREGE